MNYICNIIVHILLLDIVLSWCFTETQSLTSVKPKIQETEILINNSRLKIYSFKII